MKGEVLLTARIGNLTLPMECVVVDKVTEVLLGMDWLMRNVERLDFRRRKVTIHGREVVLRRILRKGAGRTKRATGQQIAVGKSVAAGEEEAGKRELHDLGTDGGPTADHPTLNRPTPTVINNADGCCLSRKMTTSRKAIEWEEYRTERGYRCPECRNVYELKDSFRKHFNHKHGTSPGTHAVNAVRRSSLPGSRRPRDHEERERKRDRSTDERRRSESRGRTTGTPDDRKRERRTQSNDTMEVVELSPTDPETFVERQKELIRKAHELVRDLTKRYVTIQKRRYDLRVRPKEFSSGDWVYYLYPRKRIGRSPKWTRMYTGPYLVVGVLNSLLYRIQRSARSKPILVHVDKLKKVEGDAPKSWLNEHAPTGEAVEEEEETLNGLFEVEQPPSLEEEAMRPKRTRKPPARFRDFVCQVQWGDELDEGTTSVKPLDPRVEDEAE